MVDLLEGIAIGFEQPPVPELPRMTSDDAHNQGLIEQFHKDLVNYLQVQQQVIELLRRDVAIRTNEMITSGNAADRPVVGVNNRIFWAKDTDTGSFEVDGVWRDWT